MPPKVFIKMRKCACRSPRNRIPLCLTTASPLAGTASVETPGCYVPLSRNFPLSDVPPCLLYSGADVDVAAAGTSLSIALSEMRKQQHTHTCSGEWCGALYTSTRLVNLQTRTRTSRCRATHFVPRSFRRARPARSYGSLAGEDRDEWRLRLVRSSRLRVAVARFSHREIRVAYGVRDTARRMTRGNVWPRSCERRQLWQILLLGFDSTPS